MIDQNNGKPLINVSQEVISDIPLKLMVVNSDQPSPFRRLGLLSNKIHRNIVDAIADFFARSRVDFIQASDVKEIRFAIQLGKRLGSILIYDSYEDYVRQAIDYGNTLFRKYISALIFFYVEVMLVRRFDHVFCTDEYLLDKYSKKIYSAKSLALLRNFPLITPNLTYRKDYDDVKILRLVYIGGVNRHRGVIETAQYVNKFNTNSNNKNLEFTVYSQDHEIIRELVKQGALQHIHWIDYDELMAKLSNYDIGICLWLPIKKFYRNLPIKNFDYMSQGLPLITSNFGNIAKYANVSGGGVCINPKSYLEFESAIMPMFKGEYRKQLGERGMDWLRRKGNFELEGANYVKIFSSVGNQL